MCRLRFLVPRLAGNFLAGLHSLFVFIGQNCRFEQRFTREFRAYKTWDELHFISVLSFLAVRNVSILLMQFRIVTLHCAWQPRLEHVFRLVCRTSLADCVAWERGGCAETRAVANNAVSRVTSFYLCACFSHPRPDCKNSHGRRPAARAHRLSQPQAQLIPYPSHNHSHHPSYQAQVNTTGKCERMCTHVCIKD